MTETLFSMSKPFDSDLDIPIKLPLDILKWSIDDVQEFLTANKTSYGFDNQHIDIIKNLGFDGISLLEFRERDMGTFGIPYVEANAIRMLIDDLKYVKGIYDPILKDSNEYNETEDLAFRIKLRKIVSYSPEDLASPAIYEPLQENPDERILDGRPQAEYTDIPPISLLYDGFGQFLDIAQGKTDVEGYNEVNISELKSGVDELSEWMCQFFRSKVNRRHHALHLFYSIFEARKNDSVFDDVSCALNHEEYAGSHGWR
ncbi:hypothetical protein BDQ17DRAFT_752401 [Cyathus striatus]|nr:hypothetical protein BDQ17DRAFT_752401 [Cyathus striatus]